MEDTLIEIMKYLLGAMGSGLFLYFAVLAKVAKIEGKVDILIGMMKLAEENKEKIGELKALQKKQTADTHALFKRVRAIEEQPPKSASGA